MSSKMYRDQLTRLQAEKAQLERSLATERSQIARLLKEANNLREDSSKTKIESTRNNKLRQLTAKQDDIARSQKKISDLEIKIAQKHTSINQATTQLARAEEAETKKRQHDELQHLEDINAEIEQQMQLENARRTVTSLSGRQGASLKLSKEAIAAAKKLFEMYEQNELGKESRLINWSTLGGTRIQLSKPDRQLEEFAVPIADIKELAAYGVLSLQESRSKGRTTGWNMLLLPERLREIVTGKTLPDVFRVFYSWQSWTPGNANRHFILSAVEKAVKEIRDDETIEVEPVVDRDTLGEPGSVDIVATIFHKIESSAIFVCDVTIITDPGVIHPSPNPNVMVELGYAAAVLGWERIVCVINTAYGEVEQLPFDLRTRRMLAYHLPSDVEIKADTRKQLTKSLREAIAVIIEQISPNNQAKEGHEEE